MSLMNNNVQNQQLNQNKHSIAQLCVIYSIGRVDPTQFEINFNEHCLIISVISILYYNTQIICFVLKF